MSLDRGILVERRGGRGGGGGGGDDEGEDDGVTVGDGDGDGGIKVRVVAVTGSASGSGSGCRVMSSSSGSVESVGSGVASNDGMTASCATHSCSRTAATSRTTMSEDNSFIPCCSVVCVVWVCGKWWELK